MNHRKLLRDHCLSVAMFVVLAHTSLLQGQVTTIHADITGDGVNDDIKIGRDYVLVVDKMLCCIKKRHIIVRDVPHLVDVMVDDYCQALPGKEIGVVMRNDTGLFTEIYGMNNNEVRDVSDQLPGSVMKDDWGSLYGFKTHLCGGREGIFPYMIIEHDGVLHVAEMMPVIDTVLVIEAETLCGLSQGIPAQVFVVVCMIPYEDDITITYQTGWEQPARKATVCQGERFSTACHYSNEGILEMTLQSEKKMTEVYCAVACCRFDGGSF